MSKSEKQAYKFVRLRLDEETAAMLDRAMISFGLDDRSQTVEMAVRAWCAAVMEDATIHQMCQIAVTQVRENEIGAIKDFYAKRLKDYTPAIDVRALRERLEEG